MINQDLALLCDIGSTFTKLNAVDLVSKRLMAKSSVPTTSEDVSSGFLQALEGLQQQLSGPAAFSLRLAASSAAGGLRMVAIGLVRDLTGEAARLAALGAGARVEAVFCQRLQPEDLAAIARLAPDIILLVGGTDGGDDQILPYNARQLAECGLDVAVVVAGNREVSPAAVALLQSAGMEAVLAENVMKRLGETSVDDARQAIRRLFLRRIVRAKGLDRLQQEFGLSITMPTPVAVLQGLRLLAEAEGELLAVDVGGATTDVYSLASGQPSDDLLIPTGLRLPYAHRSVEADLGMRSSAAAVAQRYDRQLTRMADREGLSSIDWSAWCRLLATQPGWLADSLMDAQRELVLARVAVQEAVDRHVGRLQPFVTPYGRSWLLWGKDLRPIRRVIGIGGVLRHAQNPEKILEGARWDQAQPDRLKPTDPEYLLDSDYVISAAGLLAEIAPECALSLMRQSLSLA